MASKQPLEELAPRTPGGVAIYTGEGSPEGAITASPGSLYLNKLGGADTTAYVKETGTGNTGWSALAGV